MSKRVDVQPSVYNAAARLYVTMQQNSVVEQVKRVLDEVANSYMQQVSGNNDAALTTVYPSHDCPGQL